MSIVIDSMTLRDHINYTARLSVDIELGSVGRRVMIIAKPITPEEFKNKIKILAKGPDPEHNHWYADEVMIELLISLGYNEGVQIFREMEKWYS